MHKYQFDALGRRIARTLYADGSIAPPGSNPPLPPPRCTHFIHGGIGTAADAQVGWQVLEEQDGTGRTLATFVPSGRYIDETVCFARDLGASGLFDNQAGTNAPEPVCGPPASAASPLFAQYWLHADDQFSTTSVTDSNDAVVERYDYHDYGFPLILDADGSPIGVNAQGLYASKVGNARLFTGREWDGESKLYHYRTRAYHPGLGRFLQIDRIGVWGDFLGLGNPFSYCASAPNDWVDPYGLDPYWEDFNDGLREVWDSWFGRPAPRPRPAPGAGGCPKATEDISDIEKLARGPRDPSDWRNPSSRPGNQDAVDDWEKDLGDFYKDGAVEWARGALDHGSWFIPGSAFRGLGRLTARGWTVVANFGKTVVITKGGKIVQLAEGALHLGNKLDFLFGKAGGNAHNVSRSGEMLRSMERIGLAESAASRELVEKHLTDVVKDPANIVGAGKLQGSVVRESLLMGPRGGVKVQTVWEGGKLITINVFGGPWRGGIF